MEGLKEKVKIWLDSFSSVGNLDFVLMAKLKALKTKLKDWSKSVQGNLENQKQLVLTQR